MDLTFRLYWRVVAAPTSYNIVFTTSTFVTSFAGYGENICGKLTPNPTGRYMKYDPKIWRKNK
ncbi:hypothetical protein ES708_23419 [subsurface metagenome]